jgi:hypothetical protein
MNSKVQTFTDVAQDKPKKRKMPPNAGKGRKAGVPNKVTGDVKAMILGALEQAGGQAYLADQAEQNPGAFMALVGKVLPKDLKVDQQGNMTFTILTHVPDAEPGSR